VYPAGCTQEAKAIVGHTLSRKEAKVQRLYCATHSISRKEARCKEYLIPGFTGKHFADQNQPHSCNLAAQ